MKRKLNVTILSKSDLFKESLRAIIESLNKIDGPSFLLVKEIKETADNLDVIISDCELKYIEKFINTNHLHDFNPDLIKVIISDKKNVNLSHRDICLIKPFQFSEMRNILFNFYSQILTGKADCVKWGSLALSFSDKLLSFDGKNSVYLTDKESDIMTALLEKKYKGINREQILFDVWGFSKKMSTHTFETHLYRLRKKIKTHLVHSDLIINKNSNYVLNAQLLDINQ